jgi:hypothetical protein
MASVFFVTGSADLVGYLQHRDVLRKSIGCSGNVLGTSSRRSVEMIAATMSRNFVRFSLKTRYNRPHNLRLPALPERKKSIYVWVHTVAVGTCSATKLSSTNNIGFAFVNMAETKRRGVRERHPGMGLTWKPNG